MLRSISIIDCNTDNFEATRAERKTNIVCKDNPSIKLGSYIILNEIDDKGLSTSRKDLYIITYVERDNVNTFANTCIVSLKPFKEGCSMEHEIIKMWAVFRDTKKIANCFLDNPFICVGNVFNFILTCGKVHIRDCNSCWEHQIVETLQRYNLM